MSDADGAPVLDPGSPRVTAFWPAAGVTRTQAFNLLTADLVDVVGESYALSPAGLAVVQYFSDALKGGV